MSYSLSVNPDFAQALVFGSDLREWDAFRAGWLYRQTHGPQAPDPGAKPLGLYPDNQNLRISWERGWIAMNQVANKLIEEEK